MSVRKRTAQVNIDEHDEVGGVVAKKVLVYGWDGENMTKVRLNVSADGSLVVDDYNISDVADGDTSYFGYLNSTGSWRILKLTDTEARYAKGTSDYTANWTNRESLDYGLYNTLFET